MGGKYWILKIQISVSPQQFKVLMNNFFPQAVRLLNRNLLLATQLCVHYLTAAQFAPFYYY